MIAILSLFAFSPARAAQPAPQAPASETPAAAQPAPAATPQAKAPAGEKAATQARAAKDGPDAKDGQAAAGPKAAAKGKAPKGAKAGKDAKAFDAAKPSTWKLSAKLPKGSPERAELARALAAPAVNPGEAPLEPAEVEALLDDPRAELVYADKTISIVAPSMLRRQRQGHLDLMAAFLKPERVKAGVEFAKKKEAVLEKAEKAHGVDRGVIVGILMWESRLGQVTGDYVAFNAFTSQLYFIDEASAVALSRKGEKGLVDPQKQAQRVETIRARARKNLLALLRQCKARGIDPLTVKGSWAGALGFPQFMPASLRWAEDGDGDGKIDLFTFDDSIASIANYLREHGYAKSPEKAVWGYNHEDAYVKGVLAFAQALQETLAKDAPDAGAPAPAPADGSAPDAGSEPASDAVAPAVEAAAAGNAEGAKAP